MKKRKWLFVALGLAALVGLIYTFAPGEKSKEGYSIGIFEVVRHPVLDAMGVAFQNALKEKYPGKVDFDWKVADGDTVKTEQMAQQFATGKYDMVYVIGTNQAQSLAKKNQTIPILLGATTDPVGSGLVAEWSRPGGNITGTSDLSPVDKQLQRLKQIMPNAKRIGIIYNPAEENSQVILDRFSVNARELGFDPVSVTISKPNEIQQSIVSMAGKIDALYAPTDATIQSVFPALIRTANEIGLPVFNCDEGTVRAGAIFSIGFNYEDIGVTSAEMAILILEGKAKPAEMGIRLVEKSTLFYNPAQIEAHGLALPAQWIEIGEKIEGAAAHNLIPEAAVK